MSLDHDRLKAMDEMLAIVKPPPPLIGGKVQYPEGEVEMKVDEYLALHGICSHAETVVAVTAMAVVSYGQARGLWGTAARRALAPVMVALVHQLGLDEKWGHLRWDV